MKLTIKALEEKIKAQHDAEARLKQAMEVAFRESVELKHKAEDAAAAGDLDSFLRLKGELDKQESVAYVRKTQLERGVKPVTDEEITAAWETFSADYEKKMTALRANYEKAKSAALSAFREMFEAQHDALLQRQKLAEYAGINPNDMGRISHDAETKFPMVYLNEMVKKENGIAFKVGGLGTFDPDFSFYIANLGHASALELYQDESVRLRMPGEYFNHIVP